jgi:hypothetical protein
MDLMFTINGMVNHRVVANLKIRIGSKCLVEKNLRASHLFFWGEQESCEFPEVRRLVKF